MPLGRRSVFARVSLWVRFCLSIYDEPNCTIPLSAAVSTPRRMQHRLVVLRKYSPERIEGFSTLFACIESCAKHANTLATYVPVASSSSLDCASSSRV